MNTCNVVYIEIWLYITIYLIEFVHTHTHRESGIQTFIEGIHLYCIAVMRRDHVVKILALLLEYTSFNRVWINDLIESFETVMRKESSVFADRISNVQ